MLNFSQPIQQWSVKDGMTFNPAPFIESQTIEDNFRQFCMMPWQYGLDDE